MVLHRIAENSLYNSYSSSKKTVLTKLLTFYWLLSTYPQLCQLEISALNDDHSLNMLDLHMNKVPTLQNAWAIKIN